MAKFSKDVKPAMRMLIYTTVTRALQRGLEAKDIAAVVKEAVEDAGAAPGGAWSMWMEKASITSGDSTV